MPVTASNLVGLACLFDYHGKRVAGIVTDAKAAEPYGKGKIPDWWIHARGASGKVVRVSMVHTNMSFPDR